MFVLQSKIIKISLIILTIFALSSCTKMINANDIYSQFNRNYTKNNPEYRIVDIAKTQIGKPYRSGGESPREGFDCSGLIYWTYAQTGVKIPRVTKEQAKVGKSIPLVAVKPGDIIVFKSRSSPNGLHTAIYEGNNKIIHSPNSRAKVRSEPLGQVWLKDFKDVRRVL